MVSDGQETRTQADALRAAVSPSAKALIMTFWGDMLVPFGGRIWLGSLLQAMAPLGLDEPAVRTSVHRLIAEGWLTSTRIGRRIELSMPGPRLDELRSVQRRMYRKTPLVWDGFWRIVVMQPRTPARREAMRRDLRWQGYATLAPNTMIHPRQSWEDLAERLGVRGLRDEIAHAFTARHVSGAAPPVELWPLATLRASWAQLGELAGKVDARNASAEGSAAQRLLIAHALRLAVLRDPALPAELLSPDWPEVGARSAISEAYAHLSRRTHEFLAQVVQLADGSRPGFRPAETDWRFSE